jgi:serine/threonine-protein kinase
MASKPQVRQMLKEMLDSGKTPEEVCHDCPHLLGEVRERWQEFCRIDAEVGALLPGVRTPSPANTVPLGLQAGLPHIPGYEVEAVLGHGGMGVVYKARQQALDRPVALKMLLAGPFAAPDELQRFHRETAALARLRHPNIVAVFDAGDVEGRPYYSMEFIEGGSLAQKLAGTPQPAGATAALLSTLAAAVQVAHQAGIVHRDLKPGNILLTADGTPRIADFGLARHVEGGAGLTLSGVPMGTPNYMAPEQARGQARAIGPAVDVYALGAILYELLTGRPPFQAETPADTVLQVISQEPVAPARLNAKVPRDLDTICLKCLQKEPPRRYATAAALAEDLGRFLRGEAIAARPEGLVARLARRVRRRPALSAAIMASALLLGVLAGGGLWVLSERSAQRRAQDAADSATQQAAADDMDEMVEWLKKSSWPEARAALERAKGRLGEHDSTELRRRLDQGQRDLALGIQLDAIVLNAYDTRGGLPDPSQPDEFAAAFRSAGLGEVYDEPKVVAARIRGSHIQSALVVALDQWALLTGNARLVDWALEVARRADPDTTDWRKRAGNQANWEDEAAFGRLLRTAPVASRAVPILLAIELQLYGKGRDTIPYVKRIQAAYPGDFRVNFRLGNLLAHKNKHGEAIRYAQAALAVRPSSSFGYHFLGSSLRSLGRTDEAVEPFEQALKLAPNRSLSRANLIFVLWQLGRDPEAEAYLRQLLALDPEFVGRHLPLRAALIQRGMAEEALSGWKAAIDALAPYDVTYGYAEYCLFLGREDDYRRARQDLLTGFGKHPTLAPSMAERIARACLLRPAKGDELRTAVALAEQAAAADRSQFAGAYPYFRFAQGLAQYRQGQLELAISTMRGDASKVLGPAPGLVLAMALHQKGQEAEARKTLAAAVVSHDWRADRVRNQDDWIYHVLRREAEGLILPEQSAFLAGTYEPKDNDERLAFLGVSQFQDRHRAVARLYADAFAADPTLAADVNSSHRHSAARAAALVGCGRGADAARADEAERTSWRKQALKWLRADLTAQVVILDRDPVANSPAVRQALTRWQSEPALACVRETVELDRMPADERQGFSQFWAELAATLARTGK